MPEEEREICIPIYHAFLLLDGSAGMREQERESKLPKHKVVAKMVQELIDEFHDNPQCVCTYLTIVCFDGKKVNDIRLADYDVKAEVYYQNKNLDLWDPIIGHGETSPIGRALAFVRKLTEEWVNGAIGEEFRRAIIYLMSDGKLYPANEPDGKDEVVKIRSFNNENLHIGKIRLFTVGFFQYPEGCDDARRNGDDEGRKLLKSLPENPRAYAENEPAHRLVNYVQPGLAMG